MALRAANRFRDAIAAGEWARAEELLQQFREEVDIAWTSLSSDDERARIRSEVAGTLEWARQLTLAGREHARGSLLHIVRRRAYVETPDHAASVKIEA